MVGRGTPFPSICASLEHMQELFSSRKQDFGLGDLSLLWTGETEQNGGYWVVPGLPKVGVREWGLGRGVEQKEPLTGGS